MKAFVNENCIGCGLCTEICPEVFEMSDSDVAVAVSEYSDDNADKVKEAADSCPVDAIEI